MVEMKITIDLPAEVIEQAKTSHGYYPTYHFEAIWKAIVDGETEESEDKESEE